MKRTIELANNERSTTSLSLTTRDNLPKTTKVAHLQLPLTPYVNPGWRVIRGLTVQKKGPEIRTGNTPGDADIPIKAGLELNITTDDKYATASDDKNL